MAPNSLALTTQNNAAKGNPNKVTARSVPAFLNKLYSMVNDPGTDELIRWSDDGDSFFVPSADRFGREILPRFFKHSNFGSFVRQLNMYGFHKVPHLQQGVLKNDEDAPELLEFTNPNFHRSQPDLLCLIRRQKARPEGSSHAPSSSTGNLALDLPTLLTDLSSIRKHQTALSADLKDLQESNHALWQEAIQSRERHKNQQDTINKILRFLATVFGGQVEGMGGMGGMGMNMGMGMGMGMGVGGSENGDGERVTVEEEDDSSPSGGKGKQKAGEKNPPSSVTRRGANRGRLLLEDVKGRKAARDQERTREDSEQSGARLEEMSTSGEEDEHEESLPTISSSTGTEPILSRTGSYGFSPTPASGNSTPGVGGVASTSAYNNNSNGFGNYGNGMDQQYGISQDVLDSLLGSNNDNAMNAFLNFNNSQSTPNSGGGGSSPSFNSPRPAILPSPPIPNANCNPNSSITPLQTTLAQNLLSSAPSLSIAPSNLNLPPTITKDPQEEYFNSAIRDSNDMINQVQNEKQDLDTRTKALEDAITKLMENLPEGTRDQLNATTPGANGEAMTGNGMDGMGLGNGDGTEGADMSDAEFQNLLAQYANAAPATPGAHDGQQSPIDYSSLLDTAATNNPIAYRPQNAQDWDEDDFDDEDDEDEEDGDDYDWGSHTNATANSKKRKSDANDLGGQDDDQKSGDGEGVRRSSRRKKN